MERWAKSIPNVQFLCICVESKAVAIAFHRMFGFDKVINGYIPSRGYMPHGYGQLGCSGFIVSDGDGCFVSRKTNAYLQYEERAFRHVEMMLANLLPTDPTPPPRAIAPTCIVVPSEEKKEQRNVVEAVPSVGVDSMDEEHEECTQVFNILLRDPSSCNMKKLYNILKEHFTHEETLMAQYSEQKESEEHSTHGTSSFSALDSHKVDHERILGIAKRELERVTAGDDLPGQ